MTREHLRAEKKRDNIGMLTVELVGARKLLPADGLLTDGSSSRDPYAELQLNTFPVQKSRTHRHTRDPDFQFTPPTFSVPHPNSVLKISIFDEGDIIHSDELLGRASINLRSLPWNTPMDLWLELSRDGSESTLNPMAPQNTAGLDPHNGKVCADDQLKGNTLAGQAVPASAALPSVVPRKSSDSISTSETQHHRRALHPFGIIQLRVMYQTTWLKQFTTGFLPAPETTIIVPPEFHATLCYNNLMRCLEYINPLLEGVEGVSKVQRWVSPLMSMSVLLAWILVVRHLDYFPVVLHAWLLFKMASGYVRKHTSEHPHSAYQVDKIRQSMRPLGQRPIDSVSSGTASGKDGLGGFIDALATWLLGMGLGAQLEAAQNAMGSAADGLDAVADIFNWKDKNMSRNICAAIFVSGLFLYVFPARWLLACVALWLMLSSTALYRLVVRGLSGLSGILATSPSPKTLVESAVITGLLKVRLRTPRMQPGKKSKTL